jgi:hypothetical protein
MASNKNGTSLHVEIPTELYKKIKVWCAENQVSMKNFTTVGLMEWYKAVSKDKKWYETVLNSYEEGL